MVLSTIRAICGARRSRSPRALGSVVSCPRIVTFLALQNAFMRNTTNERSARRLPWLLVGSWLLVSCTGIVGTSAGGGGRGGGDGVAGGGGGGGPLAAPVPLPAGIRRLTQAEALVSVTALLGVPADPIAKAMGTDTRQTGFTRNADQRVGSVQADALWHAMEGLVAHAAVTQRLAQLAPCATAAARTPAPRPSSTTSRPRRSGAR